MPRLPAPTRVGLTGNSGGGTMTTFVNALEDRLTMAAPSCYITTWLHNVENELPADSEQIPPGTFAAGLEMGDFLIARAPRPYSRNIRNFITIRKVLE